jgi:hypothetical protein
LRCHFSTGTSFGEAVEVGALTDDTGWLDPSNFLTLRTGDVTGDGAEDLCIRANAKVLCYAWDGSAFGAFDGPAWSDADGWNEPQYFHTLQLGDYTGDGRADLCARHVDGWRCHPSTGAGFGDPVALAEFADAGGWDAERYYATMAFGSPAPGTGAEECNGLDDDGDGLIDEGCAQGGSGAGGSEAGAGPPASPAEADGGEGEGGCHLGPGRAARMSPLPATPPPRGPRLTRTRSRTTSSGCATRSIHRRDSYRPNARSP